MRHAVFATIICLLSGCAGTFNHTIDFNPSEPLRIAVLPFLQTDDDGKVIVNEGRLLVDNLSLVSSPPPNTPTQVVRKRTIAELEKTGLDVVNSSLIDIDLPHHGYALSDGSIDTIKLHHTDAKEICQALLNCDAVLYGTVTKWDRSYYGVESVNTVGITLKIISARSGNVLFESSGEDSTSRGISKIPTGFSSLFLEPIKGLDSEIIGNLADAVVAKMLEPLNVTSRPAFLESSPPSIFASSTDAQSETLKRTDTLIVVAFASEHNQATFSIGNAITDIPMIERTPGHYFGEYIPLETDSFSGATVSISLKDSFGRSTIQKISKSPLTLAP